MNSLLFPIVMRKLQLIKRPASSFEAYRIDQCDRKFLSKTSREKSLRIPFKALVTVFADHKFLILNKSGSWLTAMLAKQFFVGTLSTITSEKGALQ